MSETQSSGVPVESTSAAGGEVRSGILGLLAVLIVGALVFGTHAVNAEFLNFDDDRFFGQGVDRTADERAQFGTIPTAEAGSELAAAGLSGILDPTETVVDAYLPVSHLSLELDRRLFGSEPLGSHLHSLLLHLAATAMLWFLLRAALRDPLRATVGAALFALHPALCESVLWVSGRKDLLSGLFTFAALHVVVRAARRPLPSVQIGASPMLGLSARAALFGLLAIYSKGTALVLGPIAIAAALALGARGRNLWPALGVFVVTTLGAAHHFAIATDAATLIERPLAETWTQVPGAFLHYLTTSFWPTGLDVLYPELETLQAFRDRFAIASAVTVLFLVAVAFCFVRGARRTAFGLAAFAFALGPFNTVLPATSLAAADRYLYLALPALAFGLVSFRRIPAPALLLPVAALAVACFLRGRDFVDSDALWTASLDREPKNVAAAVNLANHRVGRMLLDGRSPEQIREKLEPMLSDSWSDTSYPQHRARAENLRATLAERSGEFAEASRHAAAVAEALSEIESDRASTVRFDARIQAARLARQAGDDDEARKQLDLAEAIAPESPLLACHRAGLWLREAERVHQGRVPPDDPVFERVEAELARADTAFETAESAANSDDVVAIGRADLHWQRGEVARLRRRWTKAALEYERAIEIDPRRAEPHLAIGALYLSQPEFADEAEGVVLRAMRLGIEDPTLRYQLAIALSQKGDTAGARRHFEFYLRREPDDRDAQRSLARILVAEGLRDLDKLDPRELERLAIRIQKLDDTLPGALKMRGVAAMKQRQFDDALGFFDRLIDQQQGDGEVERYRAETLRNQGYALQFAGRSEEAVVVFEEFVRTAPIDVDTRAVETILENTEEEEFRALETEGSEAMDVRDFERAETLYSQCLELRPERGQLRMQLGLARFALGGDRTIEALEDFRGVEAWARESEFDPTLAVFYQVRCLARLERLEEALELADGYLAAPAANADPDLLERIRSLVR
ncbi:MAG: tetratricopeptide repeat protein [Planctomycetota bacterium]